MRGKIKAYFVGRASTLRQQIVALLTGDKLCLVCRAGAKKLQTRLVRGEGITSSKS